MFDYFRAVLPSNSKSDSRHALSNKYPEEKRREGVEGGRSVDISDASNNQHRNFAANTITYQMHCFPRDDINKLSEQTATACTVQDIGGRTMYSNQHNSDGVDKDKKYSR